MSDFENALSRMFPSMAPAPVPQHSNPSLLGDGTPAPAQRTTAPANVPTPGETIIDQARQEGVSVGQASDEVLGEAFYAPDGLTNEVVASYEPHGVQSLYDDMERSTTMNSLKS